MHVPAFHADFRVVLSQVLSHALGQRGDQHALAFADAFPNLVQQIIDLALHRADLHWRINQSRGPYDLLNHHARRLGQFVGTGSSRDIDQLIGAVLEFGEG